MEWTGRSCLRAVTGIKMEIRVQIRHLCADTVHLCAGVEALCAGSLKICAQNRIYVQTPYLKFSIRGLK